MRLVSATRYADLQTRYDRMADAREEAEKLAEERLSTITRLAALVSDLRDEQTDPTGAVPAPRQATDVEKRLRQELHRSERARAALDEHRRELIGINDQLNKQLRDHAEGSPA